MTEIKKQRKKGSGSKPGPRPHTWKVQGEIPHQQYCAWLQMKAQASYRKETFELTFEDFQTVWQGKWERKGRGINDYCLTRSNPESSWHIDNVICLPRAEHFKIQRKRSKNNGNKERMGD